MNPLRRVIVFVFSVAILGQAIVLWGATGSKNTTQIPPRGGLRFVGAAVPVAFPTPQAGEEAKRSPEFHFGLLPSTAAVIGPESVSLVTLGAPALLLALMAMAPAGDGRKKA